MKRYDLFGGNVDAGEYKEVLDKIIELAGKQESSYICVANVHMIMEAYADKLFRKVLNSADLVTTDGMPVALSARFFYKTRADRVAGMDLIYDLFATSEISGKRIFLYGSTDDVLKAIERKARKLFPHVIICGSYSPPFRYLSDEEDAEIVEIINGTKPDFVFVALGCPKQEFWMNAHKGKVRGCMIGLGGAFPVFAGLQSRCPDWMRRYCLEWFYRFIKEPNRLFVRYLKTNSMFVFLFMLKTVKMFVLSPFKKTKTKIKGDID